MEDSGGLVGIKIRVPKPGEVVAFNAQSKLYTVRFHAGLSLDLGRSEVLKLINQSMTSSPEVLVRATDHPLVGTQLLKTFGEQQVRGTVEHHLPEWNVFEVRYDNGLQEHVQESFIADNKFVPPPVPPTPVPSVPVPRTRKPHREMIAEHQRILRGRSPRRSPRIKTEMCIDLTLSDDDDEPVKPEPSASFFEEKPEPPKSSPPPTLPEPEKSMPSAPTVPPPVVTTLPASPPLVVMDKPESPMPKPNKCRVIVESDSEDETNPTRIQTPPKKRPRATKAAPRPKTSPPRKRYRRIGHDESSGSEQEYVVPTKADDETSDSYDSDSSDAASSSLSSLSDIEYDARGPVPRYQRADKRIKLPSYAHKRRRERRSPTSSSDEDDEAPLRRPGKKRAPEFDDDEPLAKPTLSKTRKYQRQLKPRPREEPKKLPRKPEPKRDVPAPVVKDIDLGFRIPKRSADDNFRIPKVQRPEAARGVDTSRPQSISRPSERKSMATIVKEAEARESKGLRRNAAPHSAIPPRDPPRSTFPPRHDPPVRRQDRPTNPDRSLYSDRSTCSDRSLRSDRSSYQDRSSYPDRTSSGGFADRPGSSDRHGARNQREMPQRPPSPRNRAPTAPSAPAPPKVVKSIMREPRTEPFPLKNYALPATTRPFDWTSTQAAPSAGLKPDYLVRKEAVKQQRLSSLPEARQTNLVPLGLTRRQSKEDVQFSVPQESSTTDPGMLRSRSKAARMTEAKTLLLSDGACVQHHVRGHPERPERVEVVLEQLAKSFPDLPHRTTVTPATVAQLECFHTTSHVQAVLQWCGKIERCMDELDRLRDADDTRERRDVLKSFENVDIDADTTLMRYTRPAALAAAGAVIEAVDAVLSGAYTNAFCAVRPPGHHAEPHKAMGFCFFNNVGVGAMHAVGAHGLSRVAIIDFDVHHGNGTQTKATTTPELLYVSTHQAPFFPHTGHATENSASVWNVPLASGTTSYEFRAAFLAGVEETVRAFRPQLLIISAGFDAHKDDPLAEMKLTEDDFYWMTKRLAALAWECCEGRMVSCLEGGYHLRALARSVEKHVEALVEGGDATVLLDMDGLSLTKPPKSNLRLVLSKDGKQKPLMLHEITIENLRVVAKAKCQMKKTQTFRTPQGKVVADTDTLLAIENDTTLYIA
ncbi:histone deacetylase [Achlya hypogyna]|uniref:histone deacetylase n=1 Tax=Achlya hypogyna TaxID=1202772 RepID=A0A1V9ZLQ5_ACHHY|nr:histone deacetylase [Achlya hypogyna]